MFKRSDSLHQTGVVSPNHGSFELLPSGIRRIENLFLGVRLIMLAADRPSVWARTRGERSIGGTLMNRKFLAPALYY